MLTSLRKRKRTNLRRFVKGSAEDNRPAECPVALFEVIDSKANYLVKLNTACMCCALIPHYLGGRVRQREARSVR